MRKFLITMMCIVMVVCFMPTVALATEDVASVTSVADQTVTAYATLTEAISVAKNGDTVTLLTDVAENIVIDRGKDIVLDLNGWTLTDNGGKTISNNGMLYLTSSKSGGAVVNRTAKKYALYVSAGKVTVENISISNTGGCYGLIYIASGSAIEIVSGTFTQNADDYLLEAMANQNVTIKNGTFIQNGDCNMIYSYSSNTKVIIEDGTFTNNGTKQMLAYRSSGKYSIFGGTFNGGSAQILPNSSLCTVAGGSFSKPVSALNCADGYMPTLDAVGGYYGVKELTTQNAPVVLTYQIDDVNSTVYYADPAKALNDAENLTNALVTVRKSVYAGALNAYKANMVVEEDVTLTCSGIVVTNSSSSAEVTLRNYGTIIVNGFVDTRGDGYGSLVNEATGVIECRYFYSAPIGSSENGWINHGTIKVSNTATLKKFTNDGQIIGTAEGAKMILKDTSLTIDGTEYKPNTYEWNGTEWKLSGNVYLLRNGEVVKAFEMIKDAVQEATEVGDKLLLNKDFYESNITISNTILLDLNGHTVSHYASSPALIIQNGGNLTITDSSENKNGKITSYTGEIVQVMSGGSLILENGMLQATGTGCTTVFMGDNINPITGADGASVTINGGAVLSSESIAIRVMGKGTAENPTAGTASTLTITDSLVQGGTNAIAGFGSNAHNTVIEISGGRVIGKNTAIYHPQDGTLSISGSAYLEGETGVQLCSGKGVIANITGGEIKATGADQREDKTSGDGFIPDGAALSIVNRNYPGGIPVMNVSSGKFTSVQSKAVLAYTWSNNTASEWTEAMEYFTITGGAYSSDVSAYMPENYVEYAMRNGTYIVKASSADKPAFTTGNCWSDEKDRIITEMYSAPYIPPTTPADNVTNSGTAGTDNATTSADLSGSTSTSNGTTTSTVDKTTADKIVDKAVENKSEEIVIDATANSTTAANSTTTAQVIIPTETLGAISEKTEADVTIKTDVAEVKLDNASAAAVAEQAEGDTVQIIAEKVKEDATEVHFELKVVCSDGKVISDFKGGNVDVTVALPKAMADKKLVCVYIDDNGHMSKMEGQKNADGTYTFNTGHFSSYAIMAEEEADAAIAAQKEAIKNIKIKLTSKQVKTKAGKKAVKITWTADAGDKVLDGVEVFRSTERYKGYGTEPFYTSTKGGNTGSYTNTKSLKKGTRYYYRVRGYVLVDGQKVYTDYSTKAWRTV